MTNEIIPYLEMCQREGLSLQRGMNYQAGNGYSIILMSIRKNAPYRDRLENDGSTLIYEGHDISKTFGGPDPKSIDQPEKTIMGSLTENGKFHKAAQEYIQGLRPREKVKVYEKIHNGIWSYNGFFQLVDSWRGNDGQRLVFKYKLVAIEETTTSELTTNVIREDRRRIIPTAVKIEVWDRDHGKCVICDATNELHFDHIIPFSRGGTSLKAENIQLLCTRHNLEKRDNIK
jgi:5-methylcytosine-specific restriction endonuclease McrA